MKKAKTQLNNTSELLELDEETIAIARAKFAGIDFDNIHGDEDRVSNAAQVAEQRQKVKNFFASIKEVKAAFSSLQSAKRARIDMLIDGIDFEFIKNYCLKAQLNFTGEAEAIIAFGLFDNTDEDA